MPHGCETLLCTCRPGRLNLEGKTGSGYVGLLFVNLCRAHVLTVLADHGISPYLLHSIGSMLISGPPGPSWRLGLHVLGTASDLSYSASSLTLMRLLSRASPEQASRLLSQNAFRDAELRFKKLVSEGTDPDALTLQGILLAAKGDENSALRAFAKAVLAYEKKASSKTTAAVEHSVGALSGESARPAEERRLAGRPFRWTWEASCYVGSGRILLKQGKLEEAREAFTVAAEELDTPEGYLELGKMLPKDDLAREVYLTTAAISGNKEASLSLGELSLQKAEELGTEDKTAKAAKEHGKRAAEWFAIAGEQKRGEEARLA